MFIARSYLELEDLVSPRGPHAVCAKPNTTKDPREQDLYTGPIIRR